MQPTLPARLTRRSTVTRSALAAAASLLLAVACRDATAPTSRALDAGRPSRDISDAAHGGTAHFYFLPPLVPQPRTGGTADGTYAPEVVVCDVGSTKPGSTAPCASVIARFTTTGGTGSQVIRYDATSQLYIVNWQTDQCTASDGSTVACTLNTSHFYRLFVRERVGGQEIGHADIDPVASASDLHNLSTGNVIPLVNGRTLPVKFRIEQGLRLGYTFAFQSDRAGGGLGELWVMNTDGTGASEVTSFEAASPSWSPDGTRLTFDGNGCCNRQIYVVNADGTGLINLTQDGADNIDPDWSPDGTKIAYSNTSLWVIAADGSSRQSLIGGTAGAGSPKWSPDGTKLAYAAVVNGASQIFVVNADGSGVRQLTSDPANPSMHPSWSPDGSTIIVDRCVNGGSPAPWCPTQTDIFAMNADGTNARNLTNTPSSNEAYARFTPDGAKVGFHSDRDGHLQVYLMDADGANQLNLSSNAWREVSPAFKP